MTEVERAIEPRTRTVIVQDVWTDKTWAVS